MPFIPHTEEDIRSMLARIGVSDIEALFDEIPPDLRTTAFDSLPSGLNEMEVSRLLQRRAAQNPLPICFAGGGAYEHHIPASVWEITSRGEYYSAYTPYQAEASQGTLQVIYEYQSMMTALTGMDASNASIYDGASAVGEAVLMAVRLSRRGKLPRVLLPASVHPAYRKVVATVVRNQGIALEEIPYDVAEGCTLPETLKSVQEEFAALVIPQPNYFGCLEDVDTLTDWAHERGGLVIGVVNPTSLALLKPPGEWGERGADIACGEGQPLGVPLAAGGPYFGFMTCKQAHVRQMPGRIVGRTVDLKDKPGYTLTLQAREQHIRRSKATSNICTNQGLMVTAATLYMALLGPQGLAQVASACHGNTTALVKRLTAIPGVEPVFARPFFHEAVLRLPIAIAPALSALGRAGILAGVNLSLNYPELGNALLVCATELRTEKDMECYARELARVLAG
jgi:glycine dehydrogenase subunit 1